MITACRLIRQTGRVFRRSILLPQRLLSSSNGSHPDAKALAKLSDLLVEFHAENETARAKSEERLRAFLSEYKSENRTFLYDFKADNRAFLADFKVENYIFIRELRRSNREDLQVTLRENNFRLVGMVIAGIALLGAGFFQLKPPY